MHQILSAVYRAHGGIAGISVWQMRKGCSNMALPNTLVAPPGGLMGQESRAQPEGQHSLNGFLVFLLLRDKRNLLQGSLHGAAIW